jgi:hypothetical protein
MVAGLLGNLSRVDLALEAAKHDQRTGRFAGES